MVDVVLPVLDEAAALPWVLERMPAGYRPIVADNGSTDGSPELARTLGARVVLEPRRGFGAACHAGLLAARGDVVCFMDCDGSLDPAELPRIAAPVLAGRRDLVLGARRPERGAWPLHARLANRALALELRRRTGLALTDLGPMRAAPRTGLLELGLKDRRFGWPLEMVLRRGRDRMGDRPGGRQVPVACRAVQGHGDGSRDAEGGAGHGRGAPVMAAPLAALLLAGLLVACGDGSGSGSGSSDRGAGVGALGGSAATDTLARTRVALAAPGELVWTADEIRLAPGRAIEHEHELAFAYGRSGEHSLSGAVEAALAEGGGAAVPAGARHRHEAGDEGAVFWEIRLARPTASAPRGAPGAQRVFESEPLEGIPSPAAVSLIEVTVPPRGGRTTVHTHPGPEFIYELSGQIDYQNALVGTKRLGPGGAEGIPPNTAVQKRNPYADPATFLSLFLVDPERPFAPKAEF